MSIENPGHQTALSPAAPTMGALGKTSYTHDDMIDFILKNPSVTQRQLAARYGYSESWVSNIMASDAWKAKFAKRRDEIISPDLILTVTQRMEALAQRSLQRIMDELDKPSCSPNVMLKAAELGAKSLGLGALREQSPGDANGDRLERLANRLIDLNKPQLTQSKGNLYEIPQGGEVVLVGEGPADGERE